MGGTYGDLFCNDPSSKDGYSKRLPAVLQSFSLEYVEAMRLYGHEREIVEVDPDKRLTLGSVE